MKGTFAPTPIRVMAIIQLCLAFSVLMWSLGMPFMGDLYEAKSRMGLYRAVIEDSENFEQLSVEKRTEILREYDALQSWGKGSFGEKAWRAVDIVAWRLPPFLQSWVLFSIVIGLMLLLRVEGIALAAWVLPLIVALYAVDNRTHGTDNQGGNLFPSESYIIERYLKGDLGKSVRDQREQLLNGWHHYLVEEWVKEPPSGISERFFVQVKKGQFAFNVARIEALEEVKPIEKSGVLYQKEPPFVLGLYLFWNLFFAWMVNRRWE